MNKTLKVLHIVDSLQLGGAERVAVNLSNALAEAGIETHLCVSRTDGPLRSFVSEKVKLFMLNKKSSHDVPALIRFYKYVRRNKISVIHAHSSSVFWASLVKPWNRCALIWHAHFGNAVESKPPQWLSLSKRKIDFAYTVNEELESWTISVVGIKDTYVEYLKNFPVLKSNDELLKPLEETGEYKIAHVAGLRREKDHFTLMLAAQALPNCDFYLAGTDFDDAYSHDVRKYIEDHQLHNVHVLGGRTDVAAILRHCDVGILSSESEGLPVSLLEYGLVGLPVVCTKVGECPEVLGHGEYGILVDKGDSQGLVRGIQQLLDDKVLRDRLSTAFHENVVRNYSQEAVINKMIERYYQLLDD